MSLTRWVAVSKETVLPRTLWVCFEEDGKLRSTRISASFLRIPRRITPHVPIVLDTLDHVRGLGLFCHQPNDRDTFRRVVVLGFRRAEGDSDMKNSFEAKCFHPGCELKTRVTIVLDHELLTWTNTDPEWFQLVTDPSRVLCPDHANALQPATIAQGRR